jgi:hypothetical protein
MPTHLKLPVQLLELFLQVGTESGHGVGTDASKTVDGEDGRSAETEAPLNPARFHGWDYKRPIIRGIRCLGRQLPESRLTGFARG